MTKIVLRGLPSLIVCALLACGGAEPGTPGGAGASDQSDGGAGGQGAEGGGAAPPVAGCRVASDCEPAGTSCCGCPTFALPTERGWGGSCEGVECPALGTSCPITEAVCQDGSCRLQCAAVTCELSCADGFARDAAGCLACECAAPPSPGAPGGCTSDDDCARVPADCCGCEAGGADTAVPASDAERFEQELACDAAPICPGIDVCDQDRVPRCLAGACALVEPAPDAPPSGETPEDSERCGAATLPPCASGTICTLNALGAEAASAAGLGSCRTP